VLLNLRVVETAVVENVVAPWLKTRGWTVVSETAVVENAVVETQKKHTHQMVRLVISSLLICSAG
jgi:hypothetical protein